MLAIPKTKDVINYPMPRFNKQIYRRMKGMKIRLLKLNP